MNIKTGKWIVTAADVPFLMGIGSTPSLKDMRFDVTSVGLSGPSTISNGGSANYSVSVNIQRTGAGPNDTIIGTAPNVPPPRIHPALYSGSTQLTFQEINFEPRQNSATVTLTLSCVNNEVCGPQGGSGHGGHHSFLWWSWDDPAQIKGHLNETEATVSTCFANSRMARRWSTCWAWRRNKPFADGCRPPETRKTGVI